MLHRVCQQQGTPAATAAASGVSVRTVAKWVAADRFIQTLTREWAYGQASDSSAARTQMLPRWLRYDNTRRPHGGIAYHVPFSRLEAAAG